MGEMGGSSKRMVAFTLEVWRIVTASSYLSKLISKLYVFCSYSFRFWVL